jgi:hypothetical protein
MKASFFSDSQPVIIDWIDSFSHENNWITSDSLENQKYLVQTIRIFN